MKYILMVIVTLILLCSSQLYAQSNFQYALLARKYTLRAEAPKSVLKDGKTSWAVKTTLTNHSRRPLYYFITTNCDGAYYSVDTLALMVDFPSCNTDRATVITVKPKEQRIVDLEIIPANDSTSSIPFKIIMFMFRAKGVNDSTSHYEFTRKKALLLVSNQIKT
ncbi:MAG: hypothetical protein H0W61_16640 [Bacteroidetes bacterium]|nr:hypothetical protein [Bacteroidota bacterium]